MTPEKRAEELYPSLADELNGKRAAYIAGATSEHEEVERFAEWTSVEGYYFKNGFWYYPASSIRFTTADLFKQFKTGK